MIQIHDLEVFPNYFLYCGKDINTGQTYKFEKFNNDEINEIPQLISFLKQTKGLIGYNSLAYDGPMLEFIIKNSNCSNEDIYNYSQQCIASEFSIIPEWKLSIDNRDLFKIWHFNNKNKMTSLKWIQFMIGWKNIKSLPLPFDSKIQDNQREDIIRYCFNDIDSTYEFYKITRGLTENKLYKGVDKIQFRADIKSETGLNCMNWNDVKIGDELNLQSYCNNTGLTRREVRDISKTTQFPIKLVECIPEYIEFKTKKLQLFLAYLKTIVIKASSEFEESIDFEGSTYTFAEGGLHSEDKPRKLVCEEGYYLRDADIGSMYPTELAKRRLHPSHLEVCWVEQVERNIYKRFEYKPLIKQGDGKAQSWSEALKLSLNGGAYGKTNERTSWQYDPKVMYKVTIPGQLQLLMLIEELEINKIKVLSANTDGIVSYFHKDQEEVYNKICKEWEVKVGNINYGKLEFTDYKLLVQTSVNDYLAVKTNNEVKWKGDFEFDKELHKNNSQRIVPLALHEYFVNNKDYVEFIRNHNNLLDFCCGVKIKSDFELIESTYIDSNITSRKISEKVVRFYVSNYNTFLQKQYKKGTKKAGQTVDLKARKCTTYFNEYIEKPMKDYNINYEYYISETRKLIRKIEKREKGQISMF